MKARIVRDRKGEVVGIIEEPLREEAQVEMALEEGEEKFEEEVVEIPRSYLFDLDGFIKRVKRPAKK